MPNIRRATEADVSRIAEIIVFNNRVNYFPLFGDEDFSFKKLQVLPLAREYLEDAPRLARTWVFDDGVVKGLTVVCGDEIDKLYVEPAFQGRGIGGQLLEYAVSNLGARRLWVLEKNTRAQRFYARHGFAPTGTRKFEDGTTVTVVELKYQ